MLHLVLPGGLGAIGSQHDHKLPKVDAVIEEGEPLGEGVDGELGDGEELVGGDEALQRGRGWGVVERQRCPPCSLTPHPFIKLTFLPRSRDRKRL